MKHDRQIWIFQLQINYSELVYEQRMFTREVYTINDLFVNVNNM